MTLCYNHDIFADDIEELVSSTVTSNESAVIVTEQSVIVIEDEPVVTAPGRRSFAQRYSVRPVWYVVRVRV